MESQRLEELEKVNQLALETEERAKVVEFFSAMEKDVSAFEKVDVEGVEPMVYVMPLENVLREDESCQPFSRDDLQKGAPEVMDGYWQVPRVVE